MADDAAAIRKPPSERKRPFDEALAYALGNRIRLEILAILAEGTHSPSGIAAILDEDVSLIGNHIRELFDCGCIESVGTAKARNAVEHFYRAVRLPYISDEAYRAMPQDARREVIGVILQAILTELMASFRAEKMETDEDLWLAWDSMNLDAKGRRELADVLAANYERVLEVKANSANRLAEGEEDGAMTIVALLGFERSRSDQPERASPAPPAPGD
jgi:DNA-binding transcriptional ArsR family regulator